MNGIHLHYTEHGQGLPLAFIHGFPFSGAIWQSQIDAFRGSHRVVAADLSGFGDSEPRRGPVTMDDFAADLPALPEHLNTRPAVLIGYSMGGYVALAFARQFSAMLRGLVLVSTRRDFAFE